MNVYTVEVRAEVGARACIGVEICAGNRRPFMLTHFVEGLLILGALDCDFLEILRSEEEFRVNFFKFRAKSLHALDFWWMIERTKCSYCCFAAAPSLIV
ncbi:hypothetical protein ACS0TY_031676 [Phlomoides rotata]